VDYATFVARGEGDWRQASELLERLRRGGPTSLDHQELERLASLHRRVVTDLAFSRTHFPSTSTTRSLSALAFRGHRVLARDEKPLLRRIGQFFLHDYPVLFRECLPTIGAATAIFLAATLLGAVLTLVHDDFAALFLSPQALERVHHGEIWTEKISGIVPGSVAAGTIATNNISVALFAWGGGALLGLGSLYVLGLNGLMLGSLLALTWQYGLHVRLGTFISAHGPLELTLIVVSSAAGLLLARGALVADDGSRGEGFVRGARSSVRLAMGTVPWFVILGIVEGYVSPAPSIPVSVKVGMGIALFAAFAAWSLSAGRLARSPQAGKES